MALGEAELEAAHKRSDVADAPPADEMPAVLAVAVTPAAETLSAAAVLDVVVILAGLAVCTALAVSAPAAKHAAPAKCAAVGSALPAALARHTAHAR